MSINVAESQQVSFAPNSVVSQSNEIVRGKLSLSSLNERRIFYSVLSGVNPLVPVLKGATDAEIEEYYRQNPSETLFTFPISDFINHWKITSESIYGEIAKACGTLPDQKIHRAYVDKNGKLVHRSMNAFEYTEYSDHHIAVRLTPSFMPYVINLSDRLLGYTKTPIEYCVGFRSDYSFKLLDLLLQRADFGVLILDIDDLREIFDVKDKYEKFYHLSKNVLDIAIRDILGISCEKAEIKYEPIKKGRKIVSVKFEFKFPEYAKKREVNRAKVRTLNAKKKEESESATATFVVEESGGIAKPSPRALEMIEAAKRLAGGAG